MTIQEIAYSLNFPSASFFGKYFRRYVGMTPLDFRKQIIFTRTIENINGEMQNNER